MSTQEDWPIDRYGNQIRLEDTIANFDSQFVVKNINKQLKCITGHTPDGINRTTFLPEEYTIVKFPYIKSEDVWMADKNGTVVKVGDTVIKLLSDNSTIILKVAYINYSTKQILGKTSFDNDVNISDIKNWEVSLPQQASLAKLLGVQPNVAQVSIEENITHVVISSNKDPVCCLSNEAAIEVATKMANEGIICYIAELKYKVFPHTQIVLKPLNTKDNLPDIL